MTFVETDKNTFVSVLKSTLPSHPTCSPLDDDDELDAIGLVQGSSPLLVEMGVPEVPAMCVQQSKVVPETNPLVSKKSGTFLSYDRSSLCYDMLRLILHQQLQLPVLQQKMHPNRKVKKQTLE